MAAKRIAPPTRVFHIAALWMPPLTRSIRQRALVVLTSSFEPLLETKDAGRTWTPLGAGSRPGLRATFSLLLKGGSRLLARADSAL